jgi:hypothetical protein
MSNAAADIYTPPSALIYTMVRQIHIANVTAGPVTFSLYVGASGGSVGGTELEKNYTIAANGDWDKFFQPGLKMLSTDFLSGLASASVAHTITVMGEQFVV